MEQLEGDGNVVNGEYIKENGGQDKSPSFCLLFLCHPHWFDPIKLTDLLPPSFLQKCFDDKVFPQLIDTEMLSLRPIHVVINSL